MKTIAVIVALAVFILGFISVLTMEAGSSDMLIINLMAIGFFIVLGITAFFQVKKGDKIDNDADNSNNQNQD